MTLYLRLQLFLSISTHLTLSTSSDGCGKIRTAGTGTVLFSPTDITKTCWSQEEIAVLTARVILEDTIPDPKSITVQCNDDLEDLIDYFKTVIDAVRSKTKAHKRHVMLLALTDLLGGFLHHALMPMARKAYYSGAIDYVYIERLMQLYEELKWFLRTNGQGWTKPLVVSKEIKVPIIAMETLNAVKTNDNDSCCHKLMYFEHEPLKGRKRSINIEKGIYFPLPFFDAKYRPTAIALPLKHFALRNVESKRAAFVIMKYFILAERCMKEKKAKVDMIQKFQNNLFTWIEKEVVPKLEDDKFYAAFGGVLRIQNTLKALGARIGNRPCNVEESEEEVTATPGVGCNSRRNKLLLIAMLVIIVAWFLIGSCFICYRMKSKSASVPPDFESSSGSFSSTSPWSSRSSSTKQLCKCCESTISEKSSTSESEKTKRRRGSKLLPQKKTSQSSPCVCPIGKTPTIDPKNSMKVLPSIAEISEQSFKKNTSFRKISFANESAFSSSDGGKPCAPPWAQTKDTVPCPAFKISSSGNSKEEEVEERSSFAASTKVEDESVSEGRTEEYSQSVQNSQPSEEKVETERSTQVLNVNRSNQSAIINSDYQQQQQSKMSEVSSSIAQTSVDKVASSKSSGSSAPTDSFEDSTSAHQQPPPVQRNSVQFHAAACHSSMSGSYDLFHKPDPNKPYIFGYDFQTSTSSEQSDEDDDDPKY